MSTKTGTAGTSTTTTGGGGGGGALTREQKRKVILMVRKDLAILEDQRYSYEIAMKHHKMQVEKSSNEENPYSRRIMEDYRKLIEIHDLDIALLESIKSCLERSIEAQEEEEEK